MVLILATDGRRVGVTLTSIALQILGEGATGRLTRVQHEAGQCHGGHECDAVLLAYLALAGQIAEHVIIQVIEGDLVHAAGIDGEGEGIGHRAFLVGVTRLEHTDGHGILLQRDGRCHVIDVDGGTVISRCLIPLVVQGLGGHLVGVYIASVATDKLGEAAFER
ncbi:hypothetical protein D3C76_1172390 [compost metagenome]